MLATPTNDNGQITDLSRVHDRLILYFITFDYLTIRTPTLTTHLKCMTDTKYITWMYGSEPSKNRLDVQILYLTWYLSDRSG